MAFQKHPSHEMVALFNKKPYQGQDPAKAKIIFLSSDANYSNDISNHVFFKRILEYQEDGVQFWKKHGMHHPFLLPEYPFDKRKDGVVFHRNFSKLGLSSDHAAQISFLELLDIPTTGIKSEDRNSFVNLISKSHVEYIDNLILSDQKQLVLIPGGVLREMRDIQKRFDVFHWLNTSKSNGRYECYIAGSEIREIYHFSSNQIHAFLPILKAHIHRWLGNPHIFNGENGGITERPIAGDQLWH